MAYSFKIDQTKCRRDGLCAEVCPLSIINKPGPDDFPTPRPEAEELCINCGHCLAVCPEGALSLGPVKPDNCSQIRPELALSPEQVIQFLKSRRSIRRYRRQPLSREVLAELIDLARYAPSGHNLQPARWLVIEDGAEVRRLAGLVIDWMRLMIKDQSQLAALFHMDRLVASWGAGEDRICREAPHLILAHGDKAHPASQTACVIALTYLELAAAGLGLGACWAGFFNWADNAHPPLIEELDLPAGHQAFGSMLIGHPKYKYQRIPPRNEAAITWR
ncbi:MAG: nitroreductase family protein [Deltaproteobacteria bacterium]|nr:nitroreductase family protein [Deltaproteobacteria bacterium]